MRRRYASKSQEGSEQRVASSAGVVLASHSGGEYGGHTERRHARITRPCLEAKKSKMYREMLDLDVTATTLLVAYVRS